MCYEFYKQGFKVVPIDTTYEELERYSLDEEGNIVTELNNRDPYMAKNIEKILEKDSSAKIIVSVGALHAAENSIIEAFYRKTRIILKNSTMTEILKQKGHGIETIYLKDVDDSLKITPKLTGTQYSDTSKFTYEWEIDNKIVSTKINLGILIDFLPGNKVSRFIVKDKENGIKKYFRFDVNVSSSTAGNLIMVLSKTRGKAELSYLRLDKPSNWAVNSATRFYAA